MSKTTQWKDEEISKGVVKTKFTRLGKEKYKKTYNIGEQEANEALKKDVASLPSVIGKERIKNIINWAKVCLSQLGLPHTPMVYRLKEDIITKEEYEKKGSESSEYSEKWRGVGLLALTNSLEKLGYRRFDNEYLLAEIIVMEDRVLNPDNKLDDVIECAFQLGRTFERLAEFEKKDFNIENSHKGSLKPDINQALDKLGEDVKNKEILSWLKKEGIAYQAGDRIVRTNGKNISIKTFRIMVSNIKKSRKIARKN